MILHDNTLQGSLFSERKANILDVTKTRNRERKTSKRNEKIYKKWKQNKKGMHGTDRASVALLAEPLFLSRFLAYLRKSD